MPRISPLWWSTLFALLLRLCVHATASDTTLGSVQQDVLRTWLNGLVIPLPAGKKGELPMGQGPFELVSGSCWNLTVGDVTSDSNGSSGQTLVFGVSASDFALQCHVEGINNGDLQINITLGKSRIGGVVQIDPVVSPIAPDLPLPLGPLNLTDCAVDLVVTSISFKGTSPLATMTSYMDPDLLASSVGAFVNEPLCEGLRDVVNEQGSNATAFATNMVAPLLMDLWSPQPPTPLKPLMDWDHYPPVLVLEALVRERFHLWANRVVQILTVASFQSTLFQSENVTMEMYEFHIEGVGPKHRPGLLVTPKGQNIDLFADLHSLTLNTIMGIKVTLPDQPVLVERFALSLGFRNLSMGLRAWVDGPMLDSLTMDDVIQSPRCIVQCTAGTAEQRSDSIAVTRMKVAMESLLEIHAGGSLETDLTKLINNVVSTLQHGYLPTLNKLVNGGLAIARSPLNSELWKRIMELPDCVRATMFMGVDERIIKGLWRTSLVIFALTIIVAGVLHARSAQNNSDQRSNSAPVGCPIIPGVIAGKPSGIVHSSSSLEGESRAATGHLEISAPDPATLSLARQPHVPAALAVAYPMAIVATSLLFVFADLDVGATVNVITHADGKSSSIGPIFSFSLLSTIVHSWNSGAYVISMLTLFPSGVWPYVKLGFLLAAWLVPPHRFRPARRERILDFLDTWGKYSFIDSWFLVLSMSAFSLEWESVGSVSMKVLTTPTAAFYAFFTATSISLVLGHVASECHRKTKVCRMSVPCRDMEAKPLRSFLDSKLLSLIVGMAIILSMALVIVGSFLTSFIFESDGIAMEFVFGRAVSKEYSLFNVGLMVSQGRDNDIGLLGLEVVFLALAIAVPLVELVALSILWLAPLKIATQRMTVHLCHFLDAWASLDVSVIVLVIACFEFGTMAEFLVYKSGFAAGCNFIKDLTREECLEVQMHARGAMAVLVLAAIMLMVLPKVVLRLSKNLVVRRIERYNASRKICGKVESNESLDSEVLSS